VHEGLPVGDELLVDRRLDGLEVVPGGEMANQRLGVDAGELLLADRERDDRNVGSLDALPMRSTRPTKSLRSKASIWC